MDTGLPQIAYLQVQIKKEKQEGKEIGQRERGGVKVIQISSERREDICMDSTVHAGRGASRRRTGTSRMHRPK